jgi:glycosyltransferase involved in cell wall biosynthesis
MLTSWSLAHRSAKKRLAWSTYQRHVMNQAACFHVTAQAEADEIRGLGFSQPAAIIPNAVDVPPSVPTTSPGGPRRALFLSRIHPKKGLPLLLEAWSRACPKDWILELVGPDENGHRSELEKQIHALDLSNSVFFNGPVSDRAKWKKYASADLFVLPSHSENFGIVVAEALAAGVPVLTTTGTPWQELETHDCGWWTNPSVDALSDALRQATALSSEELQKKGSRGRTLIRKKYAWKHVAEQMIQAYTWILTGGPPPNCVRTV